MGAFHDATSQLLQVVNAAIFAVFLFGPGLTPPQQNSSGPPAACDATDEFYEHIGVLHYFLVLAIFASAGLGASVKFRVAAAGKSLEQMGARAKLELRVCLLLATALSAVAAGLAMGVYHSILQIKFVVFPCMSRAIRFAVYAADSVVGAVCVYVYTHFAKAAIYAL